MTPAVVTLVLFVLLFVLVQRDLVNRGLAMMGGALLFLLIGSSEGFYSLKLAFSAIYFDALALLFGMSLISNCLFRSGVFHYLACRFLGYSRGNPLLIVVLLTLSTYLLSLAFTNLSVMIIMVPLTLIVCRALSMDPAPIVAAELITSNLGGASTLVGDFPNMIIGAAARLHFDDFIGGMMVPCLVLLAAVLIVFQRHAHIAQARIALDDLTTIQSTVRAQSPVGPTHPDGLDRYLLRLGLSVFVVTLFSFFLAQLLGVRPALLSFVAGLTIIVLGRIPPQELFAAVSGGDLLFFLGLFIMVGGLQAAGVLGGVHAMIVALGNGNATLSLLVLMWVAALLTPLLNAGPSTAFLVPVAQAMNVTFPGSAVWWSLSLGVLAGSSAALSGATAGPVAASFMANHLRSLPREEQVTGSRFDFRSYLQWGVPVAAIFLGISSLYILVIT
ncbi:MAG: hypothetical protein HQM06_11125 [Magnetococcales bacterium]|nr:hypothetical protein [Magnetococcales bacterium]